jgi:hypothetical protein
MLTTGREGNFSFSMSRSALGSIHYVSQRITVTIPEGEMAEA